MPTYQYACTACGHQLEAVQSFTDQPLSECPVCDGRLRKLFSSVGIVFKGSGFYRTDSRAAESENGQKGKDGAGKDGAGKGAPAKEAAPTGAPSSDSSSGTKSDTKKVTTPTAA